VLVLTATAESGTVRSPFEGATSLSLLGSVLVDDADAFLLGLSMDTHHAGLGTRDHLVGTDLPVIAAVLLGLAVRGAALGVRDTLPGLNGSFLHGLLDNSLRFLDNDDGFLALGNTADVLGATIRLHGSGAVSTERLSHAFSLGADGGLNGLGNEFLANHLTTSARASSGLSLLFRRHNHFASLLWRDLSSTAQFLARLRVFLAGHLVSVSNGPYLSRASATASDLSNTAF